MSTGEALCCRLLCWCYCFSGKWNKQVALAIGVQSAWVCCVVAYFSWLDVFESSFYRFGPSEELKIPFINIAIDTWGKWFGLLVYMIGDSAVRVYTNNIVDPWVTTVALAPRGKLDMTQMRTLLLVNFYWTMPMVKALFAIAIGLTQIDLLAAEIVTIFITNFITSGYVVLRKPYNTTQEQPQKSPRRRASQEMITINFSDDDDPEQHIE